MSKDMRTVQNVFFTVAKRFFYDDAQGVALYVIKQLVAGFSQSVLFLNYLEN